MLERWRAEERYCFGRCSDIDSRCFLFLKVFVLKIAESKSASPEDRVDGKLAAAFSSSSSPRLLPFEYSNGTLKRRP